MNYLNQRPKIIKELLDDFPIVLVDVGASGGSTDLSGLSDLILCFGFEPNQQELSKLKKEETNQNYLRKRDVRQLPRYKKRYYYTYALGSKDGDGTLYITKSPGTSSMLRPNFELLRTLRYDSWINGFEIIKEEKIKIISLDTLFKKYKFRYIDFLKLDTQGTEYDILKDSKVIENNVSIIKTEAEIMPLYEGQKLLHDISALLYNKGYSLIHLDLKRRPHLSRSFPKNCNRLTWLDAIFIREPTNWQPEELTLFKQAIVLAELGFVDLCGHILSRISLITEKDKNKILMYYGDYPKLTPTKRICIKSLKSIYNWLSRFL